MERGISNQRRPENKNTIKKIKNEPSVICTHRSTEAISVKIPTTNIIPTTNTSFNVSLSKRRLTRALRILLSCRLAGYESKRMVSFPNLNLFYQNLSYQFFYMILRYKIIKAVHKSFSYFIYVTKDHNFFIIYYEELIKFNVKCKYISRYIVYQNNSQMCIIRLLYQSFFDSLI